MTDDKKTETKPLDMLDRAEKLAGRIEEANKKAEELLQKQEDIAARVALSGRAEAGTIPKTEPPISDIEYSKKFFRGEAGF